MRTPLLMMGLEMLDHASVIAGLEQVVGQKFQLTYRPDLKNLEDESVLFYQSTRFCRQAFQLPCREFNAWVADSAGTGVRLASAMWKG
jgi:hypothetical protein